MEIRVATIRDIQDILDIYAYYVKETAITFEYDIPTLEEMKSRYQQIIQRYPYLVAVEDEQVIGYAYASAFHPRAAYDWCVEMSVYIDCHQRAQGIGRKLYETMETILKKQGILNVNACIATTDHEDAYLTNGSVAFHEKMGYQLVGKFHQCGYKFERWYDMVWMEKMIGEHDRHVKPVIAFKETMLND